MSIDEEKVGKQDTQNSNTVNQNESVVKSRLPDSEKSPETDIHFKRQENIRGWILTIATVALMIFAGLQWNDMNRSTKASIDMVAETKTMASEAVRQSKSVEKSLKIAEESAYASKRSAEMAEKTFAFSQRPYLGIYAMSLSNYDVGKKPKYQIEFKNNGQTPAINMTISSRSAIGPKSFLPSDKFLGMGSDGYSQSICLPNSPILHETEFINALTEQDKNNIDGRRSFIFVFGHIKYEDISKKRYESRFCSYYVPAKKRFDSCSSYNSMK